MIRRYRKHIARPFSMPFYPVPVIVALLGWFYILVTSGLPYVITGFGLLALGIAVYYLRERRVVSRLSASLRPPADL